MLPDEQLFEAIKAGNNLLVTGLITERPSLLVTRVEGQPTPFLMAIYYGQREIAELFLQRGHQMDVFEAAAYGDLEQVQRLVERQPELVNLPGLDGHTPLGLAIFFGHTEIVDFLLENGADVRIFSENRQHVAPIHAAAASQHAGIARKLLQRGADPNARQDSDFTPLHSAAQNGQVEMVRLLLEYGADPQLKAENGQTPLDLAIQHNHTEAAELLRSSSDQ